MNMLKTSVLLALLTGLLIAIGSVFGGKTGMLFMFVVSIIMNFVSYWFSDKIVLRMYDAKEATIEQSSDLIQMVASLAQKARMPMPRVYIVESDTPNAFATGRSPEKGVIAVTTGIMGVLKNDELAGVIAHELAHIKNRDTLISTVVATIAGVITMIASIAQWSAIFSSGRNEENDNSGGIVELIFMIVLAPLAATLIQMGISRSREYQADATGGLMAGNPLALANALKKIEYYAQNRELPSATPATAHMFIINPFSSMGNWMAKLFSTHPATELRVAKLENLARQMR